MSHESEQAAALRTCAADLAVGAITLNAYKQWRSGLDDPFSVPTALSIGQVAADFADACERAGVAYDRSRKRHQPNTSSRHRWTDDETASALNECAQSVGRTPTIPEYKAWRLNLTDPSSTPSIRLLERRGWQTQIALAGLPARTFLTDQELRNRLETARQELGSDVTQSSFDRYRAMNPELVLPSSSTLMRRFGKTWRELAGGRSDYSQARPSLSRSRS